MPIRSKAAPGIAMPWIVRLRYLLAAGQIGAIAAVHFLLGINLPLGWILIPPSILLASNFFLERRIRTRLELREIAASTLTAGVFVLDTVCLTAVLQLSGGPNNPFTLLYLVHITLSAAILNRRQTWALGLLACICYGLLFWKYHPIPQLEMHHHGNAANPHLIGMWVGFAVATFLVTLFSGKISELLRQNEESLLKMQEQLARKDRLAALVTLAAGAAHELNTPLATIAVVAKELEHYATRTVGDSAIADDSRLIRTEVERCREILERMSVQGAEPAGEPVEVTTVGSLIAKLQQTLAASGFLRVEVSQQTEQLELCIPKHAVEQALIALVKNAFDASSVGSPVTVIVEQAHSRVCFEVRDQGAGMTDDALRHVGEPFFTTKEPGKGMGLGIFLVRTLASRLGGDLAIVSARDRGTRATLELPIDSKQRPAFS